MMDSFVRSPAGVELRPIPGIIGYAAGSDGGIYSFKRRGCGGIPKRKYTLTPTRLFGQLDRSRRRSVSIYQFGRHRRVVGATLVAAAFHGPRPDGLQCSHLNGDASDDRPENLAWETPEKNQRRRLEHGTHNRGERCATAKLTWDQVESIRRRYPSLTLAELGREYGVSESAVSRVVRRETWISEVGK